MNCTRLRALVRSAGAYHSPGYRATRSATPGLWGSQGTILTYRGTKQVTVRSLSSNSQTEVSRLVRLDSEGSAKFVYDNFGRLRVFLKFLLLQSVPIGIFTYCYRRFERERIALYSKPLESVDEALRHLWAITRNAVCFMIVDGKVHIVNYSVGNKVDLEGVDSLDSLLKGVQQDRRDALRSIYVSFPADRGIGQQLDSARRAELLFYNQALDSFASVSSGVNTISDPGLKRKLWTTKLGDETNHLAKLNTRAVRIGFGGSSRLVELENKGDWALVQ